MTRFYIVCLTFLFFNISLAYSQTANFSADQTVIQIGYPVQFTDLSSGGTAVGWSWDFGDGNTSTTQNPTHTYMGTAGYVTVSLTTTFASGSTHTETKVDYIGVTMPEFCPSSIDIAANTCNIPGPVTFTATANGGSSGNFIYIWNFGDGSPLDTVFAGSSTSSRSHTYGGPGPYSVTVQVNDGIAVCGSRTVEIRELITDLDLDLPVTCGFPYNFTVSPVTALDPNYTYDWVFEDADIFNTDLFVYDTYSPSVTYDEGGAYDIRLTVTNDLLGCSAQEVHTDAINLPVPSAGINALYLDGSQIFPIPGPRREICAGDRLTIDEGATTNTASLTIEFIVNDTISFSSPKAAYFGNYPNVDYEFATGVRTRIRVIAFGEPNFQGCSDTAYWPDSIIVNGAPSAGINAPQSACTAPATIDFLSSSSNDVTDWDWDFDDGGGSSSEDPTHTFNNPGTYDIILEVENNKGCIDTAHKRFRVFGPGQPINVNITSPGGSPSGCAPQVLNFAATMNVSPQDSVGDNFSWSFGDGGVVNSRLDSTHLYSQPGNYRVYFTANGQKSGCTVRDSVDVTIGGPIAGINSSTVSGAPPLSVDFTDNSSSPNPITSYNWTFTNATPTSSSATNPSGVSFSQSGQAILAVTDNGGCVDRDTLEITVSAGAATGTGSGVNTTGSCPPHTATFTASVSPQDTVLLWFWDFGDGTSMSQSNSNLNSGGQTTTISHEYLISGDFDVTVSITTKQGQITTLSVATVEVGELEADFTMAPDSGGAPLTVTFDASSSSADYGQTINSYFWDFADGNTATGVNATNTFVNNGNYGVQLIVEGNGGCRDTVIGTTGAMEYVVQVGPSAPDTVNFTATVLEGCAPLTVFFQNTSNMQDSINFHMWDFGDGNVEFREEYRDSVTHTFTEGGEFTISLALFTTPDNMPFDKVKPGYIKVNTPDADFTVADDTGTVNFTAMFTDQTTTPGTSTLTDWLWLFGDGNTSTQQNPTHVYADTGVYTVRLEVENSTGCRDTIIKVDTIVVIPPIVIADFGISDSADCIPYDVTFTDSSTTTSSEPIVTWAWDFGDGNTSTQQNPTHTYITAGVYDVTLIVVDGTNYTDTVTKQVEAYALPDVRFGADPTYACVPVAIRFTDSTITDTTIASWLWDFGNGATSNVQNPIEGFNVGPADLDVQLTVTDVRGCVDSTLKPGYLNLFDPQPDFSISKAPACVGDSLQFTDISIVDTTVIAWKWGFGTGDSSFFQNPKYVYYNSGVYNVGLEIITVIGCTLRVDKQIRVDFPPIAEFDAVDTIGCAPLLVNFMSQAQATSNPVSSWTWDFGNGNIAGTPNPSTVYSNIGDYTVTFVPGDSIGCTDTVTGTIHVVNLAGSNFIGDVTGGCAPHTVNFTDASNTGLPITNWHWDFGDGNTSDQQHPTHTYTSDGSFSVTLTVSDNSNCSSTFTRTNYINLQGPTADFTADDVGKCEKETVNFTDVTVTSSNIVDWQWDFGDGTTSSLQNPQHHYVDGGGFTVSLTVTDQFGCINTNFEGVFIKPAPLVNFSAPNGCAPHATPFTNTTAATFAPVGLWTWDFGDGGSSNQENPNHTFATQGIYPVMLVAEDTSGCADTLIRDITVLEAPIAGFASNDQNPRNQYCKT